VTLDPKTGAVVRTVAIAGDIHHNGRGLAVAPDGAVVALLQGRELHRVDAATGTTTKLAALDAKYQLETMTYCAGTLYAAASDGPGNAAGRLLVTLNGGEVTRIGAIGPDAIDIDVLACGGELLFGIDTVNLETNDLYAIDPRTGARTLIATIPGPVNGLLLAP
jgi:hypothetical protein